MPEETKMQKIRAMAYIGAAVLSVGMVMATAPVANAVPFDISGGAFTPGGGYGIDASETASPTLLDVRFAQTFGTQSFTLTNPGDFHTFVYGTVNFQEPSAGGGIVAAETDDLGVSASFIFTNPLGSTETVTALGTAFTGPVSGPGVDYTLVWTPTVVNFGTGGSFSISMDARSFTTTGLQNQSATITLISPGQTQTVPESGTLALLGLGLLGFAAASRRRSARHTTV